jgi:hypothetical protein
MIEIKYRAIELKRIFSLFGGQAMLNITSLIWMSYRMIVFGTWGKGKRKNNA